MSDQQPFNPREHLIQLKSRNGPQDYLPVQYRIVWFRLNCREGSIETELVHLDLDRETTAIAYEWNEQTRRSEKVTKHAAGWCMYKATVKDGKGGSATAHGSEGAADFADYSEKAETKAVGRALAMLGFGTQFSPDLSEEHRIVDAPIPPTPPTDTVDAPTDEQVETLRKLAVKLGEKILRPKTKAEAKAEIIRLQTAYDAMIAKGRAS